MVGKPYLTGNEAGLRRLAARFSSEGSWRCATVTSSRSTLSNRLFRLVSLVTARKRRGPPGERHVTRRSYSLLRASLGSVFAAALQALESVESTNWIGFLNRLLIYAECLRGLGFDRGETLAVAISPERMSAYSTGFCRKPDNPVFQ